MSDEVFGQILVCVFGAACTYTAHHLYEKDDDGPRLCFNLIGIMLMYSLIQLVHLAFFK